ncbi:MULTISPECIES: hypothetical protein [Legionella]|uniref:Uncharacterized protein n=1 Tax=Legionella maceachernii TaxID=466 RepID=A0A0W0W4C3_9GAMM|nr:hypothetical protein [Legionella maceachernii]KTD27199.1 hypothetical protein Lmac_1447 [Legionella maceachernii]SKA13123.1 hypothetical protein SAMN02745128_02209 [Legionella maceachernii]SUP04739.1 Uncharacterised protein [Legionella maceachernii]
MVNQTREDFINEVKRGAKSIALIYSPIELHEYLVEIITQDRNQFILKGNDLCHFNSIEAAMTQAVKYGAELFFLCVDNTYDECGSSGKAERFDYIPVQFKYNRDKNN